MKYIPKTRDVDRQTIDLPAESDETTAKNVEMKWGNCFLRRKKELKAKYTTAHTHW